MDECKFRRWVTNWRIHTAWLIFNRRTVCPWRGPWICKIVTNFFARNLFNGISYNLCRYEEKYVFDIVDGRSVWQKTHRASILFGCASLSGFDTCESRIFLANTSVLNIRRSMTYEDKLRNKILIFVLRVFLNATGPAWNIFLFDNDFKVTVLWITSAIL